MDKDQTQTLVHSRLSRLESQQQAQSRNVFPPSALRTPIGAHARGTQQSGTSRDEMNLAEFPLTVLSTRVNADIKTLEFSDFHRMSNGELVERKWIITAADKFGLPTSTDDDVVLGLIRMTMDQGFRDRKVYFTRYELLKILRWSTEGRSYSRLIKSLDRLSGVRIRSTNSFYDNTTKSYQTCNFGIIDAYEVNDNRGGKTGGNGTKSFFIWSEVIFDSFRAGFIKKLDLDFYFSLRSAVSRRLYRYLDKHFYYKSSIEMPLKVLAFEKIGLSRSYQYVSSIRQQLEPAANELVQLGFLCGYEFAGRGEGAVARFQARTGSDPRSLSLKHGSDLVMHAKRDPHQNNTSGDGRQITQVNLSRGKIIDERGVDKNLEDLFLSLCERGISAQQARKLLHARPEADLVKIRAILRYYDHLLSVGDVKVSRNPVGFLYRAVESPYRFIVPPGFQNTGSAETFGDSERGAKGHAGRGSSAERARNPRSRPELKIFRASDLFS